jgi:hypothetical protein
MSMTTTLLRWLSGRLATRAGITGGTLAAPPGGVDNTRRVALALAPLQWRKPWRTWQLASLGTTTLLAPTFWIVGILLMIDAHSDHPLFWPSTMAIVALTNAVAIVFTNQRHHRRPFRGRRQLALCHFGVSMLTGCGLFLLLGCSTGFLQSFAGLMTVVLPAVGATGTTVLGCAAMAAGFGLLSFAHAGMLHAWFAFEDPHPYPDSLRTESRASFVRQPPSR